MDEANYRDLDEDGPPPSPPTPPSPTGVPAARPASGRRSGKRNDGTDSNFMDHRRNNGGQLYPSQKILLSLVAITFGDALLRRWLRDRAASRSAKGTDD